MQFIYFSGQRSPDPVQLGSKTRPQISFIWANWLISPVQVQTVRLLIRVMNLLLRFRPAINKISYNQNNRRDAKMQKREQGKSGGAAGGAATPAAKRGRPFGSTSGSSGGSGSAADSAAPTTLLGPSLQVHSSFAGQLLKL